MSRLKRQLASRVGGMGILVSLGTGCGARSELLDPLPTHGSRGDTGAHDGGDATAGDATAGDATAGDARSGDASSGDATLQETGPGGDDAGDTGRAPDGTSDSGPPLEPAERVAGAQLAIVGVTDLGLIIYGDEAGTCWALPFGGGPPQRIPRSAGTEANTGPCAGGLHGSATISHDVVFMTIGSSLYAWTEAMGATALLPLTLDASLDAPSAVASSDSRYVAYAQGSLLEGFAPVSVANVDGSQSQVLGQGTLFFDGPLAVFGLALQGPWMPGIQLTALDPADGWSKASVGPASAGFAVDALGKNAIALSDTGDLTLTPLDGTTPTFVDHPVDAVTYLYLAPDASFAAYFLEEGPVMFEVVTLPGGTPRVIPGLGNFGTAYPQSVRANTPIGPVGAFELAADNTNTGLEIVALAPGATFASVLLPNARLASDYEDGDGFTQDGSFVLTLSATQSITEFGAVPLTSAAPPISLTKSGYDGRALDGSRVLYHDAYAQIGNLQYQGTADLRIVNLATGTTSALVVSNVDAYFGLSPDRTALAYTINRGTSADGLYVTTLPTTP